MNVFQKAVALMRDPVLLIHWIKWCGRHVGRAPVIHQTGGQKIFGFRSFNEYWGAKDMVASPGELEFIGKFAGTHGVLIDIGANLGCMSLSLARLRPGLKVHAFEPSPQTFELLVNNVQRNACDDVMAHRMALGHIEGTLNFLNDDASPATNRLLQPAEIPLAKTVPVEVSTLDRFLEKNGVSEVAFMKIDVEGFEADVIQGALRLLSQKRCKAGLVELCPGNLERVGRSAADLLNVVAETPYALYFINEHGLVGDQVDLSSAGQVVLANVALLPK